MSGRPAPTLVATRDTERPRDITHGCTSRRDGDGLLRSSPAGPRKLYRVILDGVKTAISVPDDTFDRASKRAAELGMSRSEFFTQAAQRYLKQLDASSVTAQIDHALAAAGDDDSAVAAAQAGRHRLTRESDW